MSLMIPNYSHGHPKNFLHIHVIAMNMQLIQHKIKYAMIQMEVLPKT
jgi:hypothetical protein